MKMGTGDPNIPPDVVEAKVIRKLIIEKTEGVTGSEEEPFAVDDEYEEGGDGDEAEEIIQDEGADPSDHEGQVAEPEAVGVDGVARGTGNHNVQRSGGSMSSTSPNPGVSAMLSPSC